MSFKKSLFTHAPDIVPVSLTKGMTITNLINAMGKTSFEARHVCSGAHLFKRMIDEGDAIWLGVAGAGVAGGMGGMITSLIKSGFVDVICSTARRCTTISILLSDSR
jgi:deoxyhypusine synthase